MRNLKKVLALVLALVMSLSLLSIANAADWKLWSSRQDTTDYADNDAIDKYTEAVQVLSALKVFQGKNGTTLDPKGYVNRAEMATILFRVVTGETDPNSAYKEIYRDYNKFADVPATGGEFSWAAPYVNYAGNYELVKGKGDGLYHPGDNVTGYELLVMVLRALGYTKNDEFSGADWTIQSSRMARELGITAGVTEMLGQPATREEVAQIVFQAIAKASKVEWDSGKRDYNALLTTIGYDNFDLTGWDKATMEWATRQTNPAQVKFQRMTTHTSPAVDGKYDAPEVKWYVGTSTAAISDDDTIEASFRPVASWNTAVTEGELYAALAANGANDVDTSAQTGVIKGTKVNVDGKAVGVDTTNDVTVHGKAADGSANAISVAGTSAKPTGKGVHTELYVVDGVPFLTIVNTYVAKVATARTATSKSITLKYDSVPTADDTLYSADNNGPSNAFVVKDADGLTSGIAADAVVLYRKYESTTGDKYYVDVTTIHAADIKDVTVTNSYMPSDPDSNKATADEVAASYFLSGSTKYEYNVKYGYTLVDAYTSHAAYVAQATPGTTEMNDKLIFRSELVNAKETRQLVYMDDYGYVIYTEPYKLANETGYLVVRNGAFSRNINDERWVAKYQVIKFNGSGATETIEGAIADGDPSQAATEGSQGFFTDETPNSGGYTVNPGMYAYKIVDGRYVLTPVVGTNGDNDDEKAYSEAFTGLTDYAPASINELNAGDPDKLDTNAMLNSETVFIITQYDQNDEGITGYKMVKGLTHIPDIKPKTGDLAVQMAFDGANDVKYVFVHKGLTQVGDEEGTAYSGVWYLADTVPEEEYDEYDRHAVTANGVLGTKDFAKGTIATGANNGTGAAMTKGFYLTKTTSKGTVTGIELVKTVAAVDTWKNVAFEAPGVLKAATAPAAAVIDEKITTETRIVMADGCQVYTISGSGSAKLLSADEVKAIAAGSSSHYDACVAAQNGFGYATVIYLVSHTGATHAS